MIFWIIAGVGVLILSHGYCYYLGWKKGIAEWKKHEAQELNNMADRLARLFKEKVRKWDARS